MTSDFSGSHHQMLSIVKTPPNRCGFFSMFKRVPPVSQAFAWRSETDVYWTEIDSNGLKFVHDVVFQNGLDRNGFIMTMYNLQAEVKKL